MTCPRCQADNDEQAPACVACGELLEHTADFVVALDVRPGAVFHGRYEILRLLGRGGMGMVYQARDRVLDETVAIKILRPDFGQDPQMADRFRTEIKLARRVRHRNVCAIHDYGEDHGLLFISMEYVEGVDLKRRLRETGGLDPDRAYDVAIQVAEALQAVHDAGIVHRDLKTPNIMLDAQGVARLMDFGVAKRLGAGTVTATGHIVGTPEYMSPEQARAERVDARSDLYALGVLTYEMFTGRVPFRGDTPISTILKHLNDPPPLDGAAAARIPAPMRPVLRRALAKDPKDRYGSAREMAQAFTRARSPGARQQPLATDVLQAPTVVSPRRQALGRKRPWTAPRLAPWLLALPVALGAVALWRYGTSPSAPPPPGLTPPAEASAAPAFGAPVGPPAASAPATAPAAEVPVPEPTAAAIPTSRPTPMAAPSPARPSPRAAAVPAPPATIRALPGPPPPTTTLAASTPAPPGLLQIAVVPWGEVSVDGKLVGTTPLDKLSLPAGTHTIHVRHPRYATRERTIVIRPGQLEKIKVDLTAGASAPP